MVLILTFHASMDIPIELYVSIAGITLSDLNDGISRDYSQHRDERKAPVDSGNKSIFASLAQILCYPDKDVAIRFRR